MRLLRFVGLADDSSHIVVEAIDAGEQFILPVDDTLREATRSDLPRLGGRNVTTLPSALSPKQIQTRVRAGESPEAIAADHALPVERILRFAYSVLQERARVATEARRGRTRRGDSDGALVSFGDTVDARFEVHGIPASTVSWDAIRTEAGEWHVVARWRGGDTDREAWWSFTLATRTLAPLDDTATELLSDRPVQPVEPIRPILRPVPAPAEPYATTYGGSGSGFDHGGFNSGFNSGFNNGGFDHSGASNDGFFDQEAVADESAPASAPAAQISLTGPATPVPLAIPQDWRPDLIARLRTADAGPALPEQVSRDGHDDLTGSAGNELPVRLGLSVVPTDAPGDEPVADAPSAPRRVTLIPGRDDDPATPALPLMLGEELAPDLAPEESPDVRARIPSWNEILLGVRPKHD